MTDADEFEAFVRRYEDIVDTLASSPPVDLAHDDRSARIEAAREALPDHQRVPLVLFHFEGMS